MVEASGRGVVWGIGYDHTAWVYTGGYGGGCFQGESDLHSRGQPVWLPRPCPQPSQAHPSNPTWLPCPSLEPLSPTLEPLSQHWLSADLTKASLQRMASGLALEL